MLQLLNAFSSSANLVWIALLIVGFFLVVVEMYIPGFGVPGISGLICLGVSIYFLADGSVVAGLIMMLVVAALLSVALFISIRTASRARGRMAKAGLILKEVSVPEAAGDDLAYYVGRQGVARTILRPAGLGEFDGVRLNVYTDGEFIGEGTPIEVTRVEGNRIFVARTEAAGEEGK